MSGRDDMEAARSIANAVPLVAKGNRFMPDRRQIPFCWAMATINLSLWGFIALKLFTRF